MVDWEQIRAERKATKIEFYQSIIDEAHRFIEKATAARDAHVDDRKQSAAAKRASMDLTRALTEFRRG